MAPAFCARHLTMTICRSELHRTSRKLKTKQVKPPQRWREVSVGALPKRRQASRSFRAYPFAVAEDSHVSHVSALRLLGFEKISKTNRFKLSVSRRSVLYALGQWSRWEPTHNCWVHVSRSLHCASPARLQPQVATWMRLTLS